MKISRRHFLELSGAVAFTPALGRWSPHMDSATVELCRKLGADPLRPQYHLLPAHNWMNDPNGPIYFRGRYHMFHQYNPQSAVWGNMNWAHATSLDMIYWQHEPTALSPTPDGADRDGVFSGSAVVDNGKPTVIYTAVAPPGDVSEATLRDGAHTWRETQCLATAADDDLRTWKKLSEPVIATPPADIQVTGFRDPSLWREGNDWMLILGSGSLAKGGCILLYTSSDLRHWTYLHPLVEGTPSNKKTTNPVDTGDMWECPDFFPLGNKHVLLISTMGKVRWKVGTYTNRRFVPEREGVVDWGSYYAAKTMVDRDGHRILWGWISETRPDSELLKAGWAGAMSLPRMMSLTREGELQTEVAPAVRVLRGGRTPGGHSSNERRRNFDKTLIYDLAAEINLRIQSPTDDFTFRLESGRGDFVRISCSRQSGRRELHVNKIKSPLAGPAASPVNFQMFLDGSVLEVFANGTTSITARVYEIPSGPLRPKLEGDAKLMAFEAWQIKPISKDRLTSSLCR